MQITKEKINIDGTLNKKISNILKFNNIKSKLENGYIISLSNTNLAYIEPHKLIINSNTYLFFNECETFFINDLTRGIPLKEFENYIKFTF